MRIAIAGAGICGAYLYRRLVDETDHTVALYERAEGPYNNRCGIAPCAWLVPNPEIFTFMKKAGLCQRHTYIRETIDKMVFDEVPLNVKMVTIDKPKLIGDLIGTDDGMIQYRPIDMSDYDFIIDATGTARAYLPGASFSGDIVGKGIQIRAKVTDYPPGTIHIIPLKDGYLWIFPLGNDEVHIGIATHTSMRYTRIDLTEMAAGIVGGIYLQCLCRSIVRIRGLYQPFYVAGVRAINSSRRYNVKSGDTLPSRYGVGEAIGVTSPLTGEGIVPGLQSCDIFLDNFLGNTLFGYTSDIMKEFTWIDKERNVLDRMRAKGRPGIMDLPVLHRMLKRCNCRIPLWSLLKIAWKMRRGHQ